MVLILSNILDVPLRLLIIFLTAMCDIAAAVEWVKLSYCVIEKEEEGAKEKLKRVVVAVVRVVQWDFSVLTSLVSLADPFMLKVFVRFVGKKLEACELLLFVLAKPFSRANEWLLVSKEGNRETWMVSTFHTANTHYTLAWAIL